MSAVPETRALRLVLLSEDDWTFRAILEACTSGLLDAEIAAVVSDRAESEGLASARRVGIPAVYLARSKDQDRQEYGSDLARHVEVYRPELVILAEWSRPLTSLFVNRFRDHIVFLHPALPATFPGTHAIERAFYASCRGEINHTGVAVYLVTGEELDAGPVLAEERVPIQPEDTLESLAARVDAAGERLLINVLRRFPGRHDQYTGNE